MIAQELEVSLHMAFVEARQKRHEFITVEHLLLALLRQPVGVGGAARLRREYRRAAQAAVRLRHASTRRPSPAPTRSTPSPRSASSA